MRKTYAPINPGDVFGRLTVVEHPVNHGKRKKVKCTCICGTTKVVETFCLHSGHTTSCGCFAKERQRDLHTIHGKRFTKVYRTWKSIKSRTMNPNVKWYENYGALGIKLSPKFENDFMAFFNEVGNPPDETRKWSLDRIDNDLGYIEGNMRWASWHQQARNKGKIATNTTGFVGVVVRDGSKPNSSASFVAHFRGLDGVLRTKSFSINKYGVMVAFREAVKWRIAAIEKLNQQGAGYTEKHGK